MERADIGECWQELARCGRSTGARATARDKGGVCWKLPKMDTTNTKFAYVVLCSMRSGTEQPKTDAAETRREDDASDKIDRRAGGRNEPTKWHLQ